MISTEQVYAPQNVTRARNFERTRESHQRKALRFNHRPRKFQYKKHSRCLAKASGFILPLHFPPIPTAKAPSKRRQYRKSQLHCSWRGRTPNSLLPPKEIQETEDRRQRKIHCAIPANSAAEVEVQYARSERCWKMLRVRVALLPAPPLPFLLLEFFL